MELEKMYLIMECHELSDQYECNADRKPLALTDDWEKWMKDNQIDTLIEVYKWNGTEFTTIKEYDIPTRAGMALLCLTEEDIDTNCEDLIIYPDRIIAEYPGADRDTPIPKEVVDMLNKGIYDYNGDPDSIDINDVKNCGAIAWFDKHGKYYVYGEYDDYNYNLGF